MKYLVSWSGGLDSTGMIEQLLEDGHKVDAYYLHIRNNEEKTVNERAAIRSLRENDVFRSKNFRFLGDSMSVLLDGSNVYRTELPQAALILDALSFRADPNKYDRVAVGYVMGDCAISYLEELKNYWISRGSLFGQNLPELEFPLIKTQKEDIFENMSERSKIAVHWCEDMEVKYPNFCGKCTPCFKMKMLGLSDLVLLTREQWDYKVEA